MKVLFSLTVLLLMVFKVEAQELTPTLNSLSNEAFQPIISLEQRCQFLSNEERLSFTRSNELLLHVSIDMKGLGRSTEINQETWESAKNIADKLANLGCVSKAEGIVRDGYNLILELTELVTNPYIEQSQDYVVDSFASLSKAYFLTQRCPTNNEEDLAAILARYEEASVGLTNLVGDEVAAILAEREKTAVTVENFGPCENKAEIYFSHALNNSNLLVSRLAFLENIKTH